MESQETIDQLHKKVSELQASQKVVVCNLKLSERECLELRATLEHERIQHEQVITLCNLVQAGKEQSSEEPEGDAKLKEDVRCLKIDMQKLKRQVDCLASHKP